MVSGLIRRPTNDDQHIEDFDMANDLRASAAWRQAGVAIRELRFDDVSVRPRLLARLSSHLACAWAPKEAR
jgi:hypothetical protein